MNAIWIIAGLAVIGAIIALVRTWQQRRGDQDLGAVSHQCIAEHRLGHANDSRR